MDIERNGGIVDQIAIAESEPAERGGDRFQPQFERSAPTAPQHAVLHEDILHTFVAVLYDAFEGDRVVKGADKAVCNADPAAVYNIDPVCIVLVMPHDFDIVYADVFAVEQIEHPNGGIAQYDPLDLNIAALVEFDTAVRIILITVHRAARFPAAVYDAAAENAHVFDVFAVKRAVNDGILIDIYAVPVL